MPAIRSDSLWRSSPAPRMIVVPRASAAARHRTGISSMAAATSSGPEVDRRAARTDRTDEIADRLADAVVGALTAPRSSMSAPIAPEQVDDGATGRVEPDVAQDSSASGWIDAGDQPEGGRGHVAGHLLVDRLDHDPSFQRPRHHAVRSPRSTGTPRARSIRSVWSRVATASRDRRAAVRPKTGQQDRRLHLGARDGCRVVDGRERVSTGDGQRRPGIGVTGVEHRPHQAQRFDDTSHRTPTQ